MRTLHLTSAKRSWLREQLRHDHETSLKTVIRKVLVSFLIPAILLAGCKKNLNQDAVPSPGTDNNALKTSTVTGTDFTVVLMPDTQNYMSGYFGGTYQMFTDQINWIINTLGRSLSRL